MTNRVIGPGITLPPPQVLYPATLASVPYTAGNAFQTLAPGQSLQIPAGDWMIDLGKYCVLQILDPVPSGGTQSNTSGVWRVVRSQRGTFPIRSDGFNYRVANLLGTPVSAVMTNAGSGYAQATTTVTVNKGNSTWTPVVGARLSHVTMTGAGSGYGVAPEVFIPSPPPGGVQATAYATISAGALTGVTVVNHGAGYTTAPTVTILPNPYDPNIGSVVAATASAAITMATSVNAVVCTNNGAPIANASISALTLTISGAGTSAAATPSVLTTVAAITASAVGSGSFTGAAISTYGGVPPTGLGLNPAISNQDFLPRSAMISAPVTAGAIGAQSIIDGGLYLGTASPLVTVYGGVVVTNAPTVTLTQGSTFDTVMVQPL